MTDKEERINHPSYYGGDVVYEVIKVVEAMLTPEQFIGFLRGTALVYQMRAGKKTGEPVERDLGKGMWYNNYEIEYRNRINTIDPLGPCRNVPGCRSAELLAESVVLKRLNPENKS